MFKRMGGFYKKDESNKNSQDKAGASYSGLRSINYSNQRNLSYVLSKKPSDSR
ncbi:hypothetical protein [Campylobacter concisus]|jgi:hypothetical protein|uniref:hypothetical protein n=1 Tax=Campylobacter concisus TaxID=199 RepID=UPI0015E1A8AC|nr:hypothetical protein [Campylobacter concisus]